MKDINSITFTRNELGDRLYEYVGKQIELLLESGYQCKVWNDERGLGIICIEYDYDNGELTSNNLVWIDEEKEYVCSCDEDSSD